MRRWMKNSLWVISLSLAAATACGGSDESNEDGDGDGNGDVGDGDVGDGDTGDGDGDTATGGTDAGDGDGDTSTGGNMTVEMTGSSCETVDDCYPRVEEGDLSGPAMCLDRVEEGYCTHECMEDMDCCAAEGECESDLEQVCAPFTDLNVRLCFLSCEDADVQDAGFEDADEFCASEANPDFGCRSTGGGQDNRRVCMPVGTNPPIGGAGGMGGVGGIGGAL